MERDRCCNATTPGTNRSFGADQDPDGVVVSIEQTDHQIIVRAAGTQLARQEIPIAVRIGRRDLRHAGEDPLPYACGDRVRELKGDSVRTDHHGGRHQEAARRGSDCFTVSCGAAIARL
jgi:hypothetical protein